MRFSKLDSAACRRLNVALALGVWAGTVLGAAAMAGAIAQFGGMPGLTYRIVSRGGACVLALGTLGALFFGGYLIRPGKEEGQQDP